MRSWLRNHFFKRTEERKETEERERAFLENGSLLLEKLIISCNAKPIPIRNFSAQELRQATNNYANRQFWNWYKGSLEGRMVFVNRFPDNELSADIMINGLVISAQMSGHSNVLKPIGYCLETPFPISVYEFPANGMLADRVYVSHVTERNHQPMAWGSRLKIARQIAHVISYLHTAFSRPVLHMFINMGSILLDEYDVPKLIDFFYSVSIPEGETDVEAPKILRHSSLCSPEFQASGKATEKNDVYNFGQLLLELLTGEDSSQITRLPIGEDTSLVEYMHNSAQGRSINEIADPAILTEEGGVSLDQQLQAVLELALTCTEEDPHRRPTMVDVTKELRRIERFPQVAEDLWGSLRNLKLNEHFKMLLWRIANDILPTGARMKQPCEMETTCCPLCKTEEETCLHLFKSCLVAKAAWFSSNWGFCIESLNANSSYDLIKSIVIPPAHVLNEQVTKEQFVLMAAKIMDYIWRLRNQVMFENKKLNFQAIPFKISQQFEEQDSASLKRKVSIDGRMLLEKLIVSCNAKPIPIRIFSAQELWQATNNYANCQYLYGDKLRQATDNYANGQYLYRNKGSLEGQMVFVNQSPEYLSIPDLINDLVISTQMNGHSNVLKLIGCCLETECPITVYEFAANGKLADRVYVSHVTERKHQPMAWGSRLKIARQIAHVISYLHTAFSRPVIHMTVNTRNILLDEYDVPKLSYFFYSVSIPEGETDVEAHEDIRNSFLSTPECKASGKATEKNDVYNFGQLLLELLTGEDSLEITRLPIEEDSSLVAYMHNGVQGRSMNEIVDPAILAEEGGVSLDQQLQAVLELALTCTEEDPHRRPTMVDVTKELRRIERFVP